MLPTSVLSLFTTGKYCLHSSLSIYAESEGLESSKDLDSILLHSLNSDKNAWKGISCAVVQDVVSNNKNDRKHILFENMAYLVFWKQ